MSAEIERIPQFRSYIAPSDLQELACVFDRNYLAEGPCTSELHDKLLELIGAPYGCFASNGTVALYLALKALGVGEGDEVLVQDITFIASANAITMAGASPVLVDVKSFNDLTIDLSAVELTPRTKGIMLCHLFGTACSNTEEVRDFCSSNGLFLIEDAAQALGVKGRMGHCGTFGNVGTFSFYADKTITMGEGGFVVTHDEALYEAMLYLRNQGRKESGSFIHPRLGYNFRVTDLQSALGLSQLKKLDTIISDKQRITEAYHRHLGDSVEYLISRDDFTNIPFRVVAFVENAAEMIEHMQRDGIEPRAMFYPIHRQPYYEGSIPSNRSFANADRAAEMGICLPTWVGLSESQIQRVCGALKRNLQ